MRLLLIPPNYPHPAAEWVAPQHEHCAVALRRRVQLEVLSPRPYAPRLLALSDRWRAYTRIPRDYVRKGIRVHRPAYPVIPRVFRSYWPSRAAFLFSHRLARRLHQEFRFDAILSFDLALTGGLAWRLGQDLGIPACGWATGSDIRSEAGSASGRNVQGALRRLAIIFYQSEELRALGANLLAIPVKALPHEHHIVLAQGAMRPETLPGEDIRRSVRASLNVSDKQIVILYLGRIVRGKGLFELVDGFGEWTRGRSDLVLLLVGSFAGFDETPELQRRLRSLPGLDGRVRILPACEHGRIWDYFKAADVFAFPSFREGMPTSLLEAMVAGLPAVAFSIPCVQEITRFGKGLVEVPSHDFSSFGDALVRLAEDPALRRRIGEQGRVIVQEHFTTQKNMFAAVDHIQKLMTR